LQTTNIISHLIIRTMKLFLGSSVASLAVLASAQRLTNMSDTSPFPRNAPVPGNYTGGLRPQVHFSPPQGFMNDPNGMFLGKDGTYHLYYQYNPSDIVAGNQHWGHATSKDLYHWDNQPIALYPPVPNSGVFSGSAVTDSNNTSGFFPSQDDGVVAIFTVNYGDLGLQTQDIAYSRDGGYTFEWYEGNPVLDTNSANFRDPKVARYGDEWVMVVTWSQDFTLGFYTSPNLKNWTHTSNFTNHGLLGAQYECPNLVSIPTRDYDTGEPGENLDLLTVSINPGAPLGGSVTQYFIGHWNGTHFNTIDDATRLSDFAKDNYAGQFFYGIPEDQAQIDIAWASNWQYTNRVPTGSEGWRSAMSLPRTNYLTNATRIGWTLVTEPYGLEAVTGSSLEEKTWTGNGSAIVDFADVESNAVHFSINVTNINATDFGANPTLNFTFMSPVSGESIRAGFQFSGDSAFWLDRSHTNGFADDVFWNSKFSTADIYNGTVWNLEGVIDRSVLEVYVDRGIHAATMLFFPDQPLTLLNVASRDLSSDAKVEFAVWGLESGWAGAEDANGTVAGNVTRI
jgi:beta-fructofuranosidase